MSQSSTNTPSTDGTAPVGPVTAQSSSQQTATAAASAPAAGPALYVSRPSVLHLLTVRRAQPNAVPGMPAPLTRTMGRLVTVAPVRAATVRDGRVEILNRNGNIEALMAQRTGTAHPNRPCLHCAGGAGVWTECVTVNGLFGGSCANCHYGSEGARCSFRKFYTCSQVCTAANGP
jgi:hypothetical protein